MSIQPVLEKELRQYRPVCWSSEDLVFADGVPSMKVFKKDLMSAGISYIDSQGRRCDFHALRHTLCTNLARADVSAWKAMEMMRHSDIKLTTKTYTDAGKLSMREVVGRLPDFSPITKGDTVVKGVDLVSRLHSHESGFSGQNVSSAVNECKKINVEKSLVNIGVSHDLSLRVTKSQKSKMAERGGFEPPVPVYTSTAV